MEINFLGVCSWISKKTNIDVTWVRIGFIFATILGLGSPILIYFILYILLQLNWID
jgi:phage shock protein PspC (stress-responsive transcriptional regulator)